MKKVFPQPVVITLTFAFAIMGCRQSDPVPLAPPSGEPYASSFSASGWTFHLRPLDDSATDLDKAKEVWRDLFPAMAADPETRELVKRLHGDLAVELVVLDGKQLENKDALTAPPPEGVAVVMRMADISHSEEVSETGTVLVRVSAYGRAVLIEDGASPVSLDHLAETMKEEPSPGDALALAMEDYVLRHVPGGMVVVGPAFAFDQSDLPRDAEEQRRRLEQRIESYASHAKAFYDARRKP